MDIQVITKATIKAIIGAGQYTKEGVNPRFRNKPHHIQPRQTVTVDTEDEDRPTEDEYTEDDEDMELDEDQQDIPQQPQVQRSFLRFMANILLPEEIIGVKYPDYYNPTLELVQFSFEDS